MEHDDHIIIYDGQLGKADDLLHPIASFLRNGGAARLAQSMIAPIRARLDYQGIARKIFTVQELPPGALSYYDKDPE